MGKPLISDAQMRAMHRTMLRVRELRTGPAATRALGGRKQMRIAFPEAVLAAMAALLQEGDAVVTHAEHPLLQQMLSEHPLSTAPEDRGYLLCTGSADDAARFAAGYAMRQQWESGSGGESAITVAIVEDGAISEAVKDMLASHSAPVLLLSCARQAGTGSAGNGARRKRSAPASLPVIPVDSSDAVAVCRVLQESMLRARGGLSSVWVRALDLPGSADPLAQMEAHLKRRGLRA